MLAARNGWRWLSCGQLLRDSRDPEIRQRIQSGQLVSFEQTNKVIGQALENAKSINRIILDGYPRTLAQAQWLIAHQAQYNRSVDLAIILEVPLEELQKRLKVRGRSDDTDEGIAKRHAIYNEETAPILDYLNEQDIQVVRVDGVGSVGTIHDQIQAEVEQCERLHRKK